MSKNHTRLLRHINMVVKTIKKKRDPNLSTDYMEKKRLLLAQEICQFLEEGKDTLTFSKKPYRCKYGH